MQGNRLDDQPLIAPPLVTIYIPTKNRLTMLRRAITSCINQSYPHLDIIVVDDGSENLVQQDVLELEQVDSRIRVFLQPVSLGAPASRNLAITYARGEFITGLDDDDEFLPNRISDFIAAVKNFPTAGFFCTGYRYILPSGQHKVGLKSARTISLQQLLTLNVVGNQVFCRLNQLKQTNGFDSEFVACQDYDLWIRLALHAGSGLRLNSASYVVHQEHEHIRISTMERRQQGHLQLLNKHQHLMSEQQRKIHEFLPVLYAKKPNLVTILRKCPIPVLHIALKLWLLRKFGYQV